MKSMSIFSLTDIVPENFIITLINSTFISYYVDNFVNNTQTFQINDARQLPVIIPTLKNIQTANDLVNDAIRIKILKEEKELEILQKKS